METKLMHVRINVSKIEKSLAWYEDVLGFEADVGWPLDKPTYVSFKSAGGAVFSIMEEKIGSCGRMNFGVDNVDEMWKQLKDKVDIVEPLFNTPYGTRKFTVKDLDGNELGFVRE